MTRVVHCIAVAFLTFAVSCTSERAAEPPAVRPGGPPRVRLDAVRRHAAELEDDLALRAAGSQEEAAAGTYVLGHLQKAGYFVYLEPVPVSDTVRSTDFVALPPDTNDPATIVAVPYDSPSGKASGGEGIGVFLELARALRVAEPGHEVAFAALGAEHAHVAGGDLGSRALVRFLLDRDQRPEIVTIDDAAGSGFSASGDLADDLSVIARRVGASPSSEPPTPDEVFSEAGFRHAVVAGAAREVARVLFEYLRS